MLKISANNQEICRKKLAVFKVSMCWKHTVPQRSDRWGSKTLITGPLGLDVILTGSSSSIHTGSSNKQNWEFLAVCVPQRSCNKCLLSCALPLQPLVMNRRRREAVRKERRIDLGPAPRSEGNYTAAAYRLFHSPSIITFDSHRFSRSAAIFHTSFTVQSQSAISLGRGMPLFSAAWFFSVLTLPTTSVIPAARRESTRFHRTVMSLELYLPAALFIPAIVSSGLIYLIEG